jgi:hypothetical protein
VTHHVCAHEHLGPHALPEQVGLEHEERVGKLDVEQRLAHGQRAHADDESLLLAQARLKGV